jgi:hypothetical protein
MLNRLSSVRSGISFCLALMVLSGCAGGLPSFLNGQGTSQRSAPAAAPAVSAFDPAMAAPPPAAGARTADALDTTTAEQKAAALAAPETAAERELGSVAVSLGAVTEAGFWLRTALVSAPASGRVVTASGKSVQVELRPGAGAAQLSLAGFRALELDLTLLPEVTVFAAQ